MPNQIMVIQPYWHADTWVFDDPDKGLDHEPFVGGIPEMLDILVEQAGIKNAKDGFRLLFSGSPFPNFQECAKRLESEFEGWYYGVKLREEHLELLEAAKAMASVQDLAQIDEVIVEIEGHKYFKGWLCPALFKYFEEAPETLYVKAEPPKAP